MSSRRRRVQVRCGGLFRALGVARSMVWIAGHWRPRRIRAIIGWRPMATADEYNPADECLCLEKRPLAFRFADGEESNGSR